ncbi:efflux RND transporter periplasmic adaptor subunit [Chitinophaga agrisoli]|uniref:Efflux RND transporter periplasmic adaptor subunit n=1 Tax=Chitinophaga agrisoli TaxID=2607653 RepID=A0A5B2VJK5_9BACT|nr:efflux RND transporter periplasmic adaptor subunit [Chitinophaga agrisoli]KAA2239261.1 efflux RND transporter periplasmic adaptor subunit [Chitinophaga agrisoli]
MQRIIQLLSIAALIFFSACSSDKKTAHTHAEQVNYTCPMHPQVVQHGPGTCPICGMDLVPVNTGGGAQELMLDQNQMALANISTMVIGAGNLDQYKRLNGRLVTDPQRTAYVSSRAAGRIEQLYVKETGVAVRKGQPLYRIYAEQLAALQQEYLVATAQTAAFPDNARFQQIEAAARQKLLLYDVPAATLDRIKQQQKTDPYLTYTSPVNGVVAAVSVTEGQYVGEGSTILQLEDYDQLWVEADVYPAELSQVKTGQQVKVTVSGWENEPVDMQIDFITPALQSGTQLAQLRGVIRNRDHRWQPGLQANILLPAASRSNVLTLPVDAVIRDGKGAHVWIKKGADHFAPRVVKTGTETADQVEITTGLQSGDTVVVTGAYLLYSEYVLKKGANPLATHAH